MGLFNTSIRMGASGGVDDYEIERSLRFSSSDSPRLDRTPTSDGNRKTWTKSFWIKRGTIDRRMLFGVYTSGNDVAVIEISDQKLSFYDYLSPSYRLLFQTTQLFRDPAAFYHFVIALDTTQSTESDRVKIYVNGSQITSFSSETYPSQNLDVKFNTGSLLESIGTEGTNHRLHFDGYMAEVYFIDGTALNADSFGETDASTGQWVAKEYSGSYGTNGFYLNFSDNSGTTATTLGKDSSGNGNNFTPNNFSVAAGVGNDSLTDTPTNNFSTLNPIQGHGTNFATISNGNLEASLSSTTHHAHSSIAMPPSGKWYAECKFTDIESGRAGIQLTSDVSDWGGIDYLSDGAIRVDDSVVQSGLATISDDDIVGMAVNRDANTIQFYKNGSTVGSAVSISATGDYQFIQRRNSSSGGNVIGKWNFGQRAFGNLPTGFDKLCTANLPDPTIKLPTGHFNTVLYTGNDGTQSITGVGFQPDLVWIKDRSSSGPGHILTDAVRGAGKAFFSNNNAVEDTNAAAGYLSAFGSDGFTVTDGSSSASRVNASGDNYVAWNWKGGGAASSNSDGSITSSVSANTSAGFSIVSYTGSGSDATVGHGLGVKPDVIVVKSRTQGTTGYTGNWDVYHSANGATKFLYLNTTAALGDQANIWQDTEPTSSVFSIGTAAAVNTSSDSFIAYCFSEVAGYSKFGFFEGNGNADGPMIFTGFKPAFTMIKAIDATWNWIMQDTARFGGINSDANDKNLAANDNSGEPSSASFSGNQIDYLSNGFKLRSTAANTNASGTYVYFSFAESPFKYSNAR